MSNLFVLGLGLGTVFVGLNLHYYSLQIDERYLF